MMRSNEGALSALGQGFWNTTDFDSQLLPHLHLVDIRVVLSLPEPMISLPQRWSRCAAIALSPAVPSAGGCVHQV